MGQEWSSARVGGGGARATMRLMDQIRLTGQGEYLKTWTLSWGQQVAYHLGWRGPLGIQPGSGEDRETTGAMIQGQRHW